MMTCLSYNPVGAIFGFVEVWDVSVGVLESEPGSFVFIGSLLEERVVLMQWSFSGKDVQTAAAVSLEFRMFRCVCLLKECGWVDLHGCAPCR